MTPKQKLEAENFGLRNALDAHREQIRDLKTALTKTQGYVARLQASPDRKITFERCLLYPIFRVECVEDFGEEEILFAGRPLRMPTIGQVFTCQGPVLGMLPWRPENSSGLWWGFNIEGFPLGMSFNPDCFRMAQEEKIEPFRLLLDSKNWTLDLGDEE